MAEGSSSGGGKSAQQKKTYKFENKRGGGGGRGGRGGGRGRGGGGGGEGRGGRGGRGGGGGGGRGRGGGGRGGASGPWDSDGVSKPSHLGRYRDDPLPDIITLPGILVTAVQNKERSAERELVEALEQIADILYPDTGPDDPESAAAAAAEGEEEEDMETMLQRELNGISSDQKSKRFRLCRHDTPCLFYVNVLAPLDPLRLVDHLLRQIERTARCPFKFVRRVVPISATSTATLNNLKSISEPVIKAGFQTPDNDALKFGVVVNTRNTQKLDRLEMIRTVAENVEGLPAGHSVDLGKPDRTIIIEVNKNTLGVSVVEDYDKLRKYNVVEIAKAAAIASRKQAGSAGENATPADSAEVLNRAGAGAGAGASVGGVEKRKAEELDEMEVEPSTAAAAVAGSGEEAVEEERAAKQHKTE